MKENNNIAKWTAEACQKIAFLPDRKAMERELTDHYEDHRDALLDGGMSAADAEELALRAMGDAAEVSEQLAQVYNTIWTRLWQFSRGALWTLLILFVLCRVLTRWTSPYKVDYFDFGHLDADTQAYYSQEALAEYNAEFTDETVGKKLTLTNWTVGTSNAKDTYMDFDWSVEKWATMHYKQDYNDLPMYAESPEPFEDDRCIILLKLRDHAINPGDVDFYWSDFHVVDDQATRYSSWKQREAQTTVRDRDQAWVLRNCGRVWNQYYVELTLRIVPEDAEWIELRAGGESGLRLRIDLTNGEVLG